MELQDGEFLFHIKWSFLAYHIPGSLETGELWLLGHWETNELQLPGRWETRELQLPGHRETRELQLPGPQVVISKVQYLSEKAKQPNPALLHL